VEIERLQKMLEGGIPIKSVVKESSSKNAHSEIKKLEIQLEGIFTTYLFNPLSNYKIFSESEKQKHDAMKNAVNSIRKCDKMKKEMQDIDKLACQMKEAKEELEERLTHCEKNFRLVCDENHQLKDQLAQRSKSRSCSCSDRHSQDKKRLQEKLDRVTRELNEKNERGLFFQIHSSFVF